VAKIKGAPRVSPYAACPDCGKHVLFGTTAAGETVALDVDQETFVVIWHQQETPRLTQGRGYPRHIHEAPAHA